MSDLQKWADDIENYIRPSTFPLAVKLATPGERIPEKAKIPGRDLNAELSRATRRRMVLVLQREELQVQQRFMEAWGADWDAVAGDNQKLQPAI